MAKMKFTLNRAGVRQLLRSPAAMAACKQHAAATCAALGGGGAGYTVSTRVGSNRVNAEVAAFTREAIEDCYENNTIMKALR